MEDANSIQHGGDHYRTDNNYQVWDLIVDQRLKYLEGCAVKYVARYKLKNNARTDLMKAAHYMEKMIEVNEYRSPLFRIVNRPKRSIRTLNNLDAWQSKTVQRICDCSCRRDAKSIVRTIKEKAQTL